jgi:hemoglobin-like flavoprotein
MDLDALETSFDLVAPRGDELMEIFYANLFAAAPSVQPLFAHTDMQRQRSMLLAALGLLRRSLRNLEAILPALREMGSRHVAYGAMPEHYPVVGQVLIGAMQEVGGRFWHSRYTDAWEKAFAAVSAEMIAGAEAQLRLPAAA